MKVRIRNGERIKNGERRIRNGERRKMKGKRKIRIRKWEDR